jgi:hypothetical protein
VVLLFKNIHWQILTPKPPRLTRYSLKLVRLLRLQFSLIPLYFSSTPPLPTVDHRFYSHGRRLSCCSSSCRCCVCSCSTTAPLTCPLLFYKVAWLQLHHISYSSQDKMASQSRVLWNGSVQSHKRQVTFQDSIKPVLIAGTSNRCVATGLTSTNPISPDKGPLRPRLHTQNDDVC